MKFVGHTYIIMLRNIGVRGLGMSFVELGNVNLEGILVYASIKFWLMIGQNLCSSLMMAIHAKTQTLFSQPIKAIDLAIVVLLLE